MVQSVSRRDMFPMSSLAGILGNPWVDRSVAAVASIPFAYSLHHEFKSFGFNFAWIVANTNFLILIVTMLIRHRPTRVTPNPLYWLLAFVATYWLFIVGRFADHGTYLAPSWLINGLGFVSFVISVWARVSLGRSIGLVPAQRKIVMTGAYRYMRHPIYTGIYLSYVALALQNFSALNAAIFALGIGLFMIKSVVEENFLRQDAEYESYMARVRWRWVPFVA
jgi:protein-S-isoprenylcysteine O-methyltransferase Ste14